MPPRRPAIQLCPLCAHDDDVTIRLADDLWVMTCTARTHPAYLWTPSGQDERHIPGRSGIGEELGVYDDLLACVAEGFAETGVIEYRYSKRSPSAYHQLVDRYGHTALASTQYSASAFLARALSQLWEEELIYGRWVAATGRWAYNSTTGGYGPLGTSDRDKWLSWEDFAIEILKVDPQDWPPLSDWAR